MKNLQLSEHHPEIPLLDGDGAAVDIYDRMHTPGGWPNWPAYKMLLDEYSKSRPKVKRKAADFLLNRKADLTLPGKGKSKAMKKWAKKHGHKVKKLKLKKQKPSDCTGYMMREENDDHE